MDDWGILAPEDIGSVRRTRTLGVISVIREYNDLAVPGLGNVFFGKQLLLALLGIRLAESLRKNGKSISNIAAANAVEALACLLKIKELRGSPPEAEHAAKLRGTIKLRHGDESFQRLAAPGGYVTQPMRMATVQPLVVLGLVEADAGFRFNNYKCSALGERFVKSSFPTGKGNRCPEYQLLKWAENRESHNSWLAGYLDLFKPSAPSTNSLMRELLAKDQKREALIQWMRKLPSTINLRHFEKATSVPDHARQIIDGANFVGLRNSAAEILDMCEGIIRKSTNKEINLRTDARSLLLNLHDVLLRLNAQAKEYGDSHIRLSESSRDAADFVKLCSKGNIGLVSGLVERDGNILRMIGDRIKPGPAFDFQGESQSFDTEGAAGTAHLPDHARQEESPKTRKWPDNISPRIVNLFKLMGDIQQHGHA